ncbi:MAG: hypothetical protein H6627_03240 [Calditrichae bacterium]|nr:hypothetical protein [Calditrichota bacterium]MCB9057552.1 hypothetical protein [Calditrichia bacterium]
MFWGIPYNKWHFVLTVVAVALSFFLLWFFLSDLLIPGFGKWTTALAIYFLSFQIAHHLQSWNEIKQALDPEVESKYGSFKGFQENSRDDFKWFWVGISVSWLIPLIIVMV